MLFTEPYLIAHGSLLVLDHDRKHLDEREELQALGEDLDLAVSRGSFLSDRTVRQFPKANLIEIDTEAEFFDLEGIDALVTTAEGGSAWTLAYPEYGVVLPVRPAPEIPLVLPVAGRDQEMVQFLNVWIGFQRAQGTIDDYFDFWIQGEGLEAKEQRWSIGRDVLGWW